MKKIVFLICALTAISCFADTMICKSPDFNPRNNEGQALRVSFSPANEVLLVKKIKGSWYCDVGTVKSPNLLANTNRGDIYDVNFQCDERWGRLIVPNNFLDTKTIKYEFKDTEGGVFKYTLTCKK